MQWCGSHLPSYWLDRDLSANISLALITLQPKCAPLFLLFTIDPSTQPFIHSFAPIQMSARKMFTLPDFENKNFWLIGCNFNDIIAITSAWYTSWIIIMFYKHVNWYSEKFPFLLMFALNQLIHSLLEHWNSIHPPANNDKNINR